MSSTINRTAIITSKAMNQAVWYIGGPEIRSGISITDNMDFILSLLLLLTFTRTVRVLEGIRNGISMILFILV